MAVGFHALGGAAFDFAGETFETVPGECWVGSAHQGSESSFALPTLGFRTASLRMTPHAAADLLLGECDQGFAAAVQAPAAGRCHVQRGLPVSLNAIRALFDNPFSGHARRLFLEAGVLALLAEQASSDGRQTDESKARARRIAHAARDLLDDNLLDPPSIMGLARIVGANDFALKRAFKQAFGVTIFGYVRARRMERAALALRRGETVQNAAFEAGFACPSRFSQAFRKTYGAAPSTWR